MQEYFYRLFLYIPRRRALEWKGGFKFEMLKVFDYHLRKQNGQPTIGSGELSNHIVMCNKRDGRELRWWKSDAKSKAVIGLTSSDAHPYTFETVKHSRICGISYQFFNKDVFFWFVWLLVENSIQPGGVTPSKW